MSGTPNDRSNRVRRYVGFLAFLLSTATFAQSPVEGTIRDFSGGPIRDAAVSLQRSDGRTVLSAVTNKAGKFHLGVVDTGTYTLEVQAAGYYVARYPVALRTRKTVSFTVELQKKKANRQTAEIVVNYGPPM